MKKITQIKRAVRAISPVISVLLLIAIAVVAALVAYAWVMGYIFGTTVKVGHSVQVQSVANVTDAITLQFGGKLLIYVQNVGQGPVKLSYPDNSVYVNNVPRTILHCPHQT